MKKNLIKLVLCVMVLSVFLIMPDVVNAKSGKGYNIRNTFSGTIRFEIKVKKYDRNQDGYLSKGEIKKIKSLYLEEYQNTSVKGLSKLKYLKKITIKAQRAVYHIKEVEKLHGLEDIHIKVEPERKLVFDLRKFRKIRKLAVEFESEEGVIKIRKNNKIKYLNLYGVKNSVSIANKCLRAKKICIEINTKKGNLLLRNRKNLKLLSLSCAKNINKMDIQNCAKLEKVKFSECKSTSCTIENNPKLQFIKMYDVKVPNLIIKSLKGLKWINIDEARISKFSLNELDNLKQIKLYDAKGLTNLTISNFPKLWNLEVCRVPDLQSFTVENLKNLKQMSCVGGKVTELNIVGYHKLKKVEVHNNRLKTFAYENLKNVRYLNISKNQIEGRFDFTLYPKLYDFDCSNNRISEIYGGPLNREIGYINCSNNNMKLLHFTELDKYAGYIFYVNCKKNPDIEVHAWMEDYDSDPTANIPYH